MEQPEIIKQGGRYGVRLRAKAPSIHKIRADIQAEVSPIVGSEKQSEDMLGFLLEDLMASRAACLGVSESLDPDQFTPVR